MLGLLVGQGGMALTATADLLREISGLVDYQGEDLAELVEAVRKRVLTCASCEAEDVIVEIRGVVGYTDPRGDSGLPEYLRRLLAESGPDCAECDASQAFIEIADLVGKKGASSGLVIDRVRELAARESDFSAGDLNRHWVAVMRACGLEDDGGRKDWIWAGAAAVQTIGELERDLQTAVGSYQAQEREVEALRDQVQQLRNGITSLAERKDFAVEAGDDLRDRLQESQSRLLWYREALQVLRQRLGLDELGADEDVVERMLEAIASQAQALTRFQELARHADLRADQAEAELRQARSEIEGLRDQVAATELADALKTWESEPAPSFTQAEAWDKDTALLADFGRRVLRGEVAVEFRGARS